VRFAAYQSDKGPGLAVALADGKFRGLAESDAGFPGTLPQLVAGGADALRAAGRQLAQAAEIDLGALAWLPPLPRPGKIICVGLNYVDHSLESGFTPPAYPTIFARFASSLIGHGAAIRRPLASTQLDYEGEMVAVIGLARRPQSFGLGPVISRIRSKQPLLTRQIVGGGAPASLPCHSSLLRSEGRDSKRFVSNPARAKRQAEIASSP